MKFGIEGIWCGVGRGVCRLDRGGARVVSSLSVLDESHEAQSSKVMTELFVIASAPGC